MLCFCFRQKSQVYNEAGKLRRIHNLIFVPGFEVAEKVSKELLKRGCNLSADGRPIVGLSSRNLLELILSIDERTMLIPCHVWTPHFGVYGSKSGYDSLEEAFGDLSKYVYGIETGISSDPEMNWRIPELANRSILSFSDAHSPANMIREATVFDLEKPTYASIRQAIMRKGGKVNKIEYTIEFYPEEGKYHFSGHRNCKVSISPEELPSKGKICSVCHREFTEGVAPRIEQLAGAEFAKDYKEIISDSGIKWYTDQTGNHPPYVKLVRLSQVIAAGLGVTVGSQKVPVAYSKLCPVIDSEINILLRTPLQEIEKAVGSRIAQTLDRVRSGKVEVDPGYDGLYGKDRIYTYVKRRTAAFFILEDVFIENRTNLEGFLQSPDELEKSVMEACESRYKGISAKVRTAIIRSVIFILLTKLAFAFVVEGTYERIVYGHIIISSIIINTTIPPLLMVIVSLFIRTPGVENSRLILKYINQLLYQDNPQLGDRISMTIKQEKNPTFHIVFNVLWVISFVLSFGGMILVLSKLNFNPISQFIFLFFLAIVSFLSYRISLTAHVYRVGEKQGLGTLLVDFFFMPVIRVGRKLTQSISQVNIFLYLFDFLIEAPFKLMFAFFDQWFYFLHAKTEELE